MKRMMKTDTIISAGLILRTSLGEWDQIKRLIRDNFSDTTIVYQKSSLNPLRIVSQNGEEN